MQRNDRLSSAFLVVAALGLAPVALAYGVVPEQSLPWLYGIDASDLNTRHVFRAIMGLYLAMVCFWVAGAVNPGLRVAALWSLIVFMGGLGLGRLGSVVVDGWPHPLFVLYLVLEFVLAVVGILLVRSERSLAS